jgi:translocation and assembly module TamA
MNPANQSVPVIPAAQRPGAWRSATVALVAASLAASAAPAAAFEIFGWRFFEPETAEELGIVDPLHYTVTLDVEGEDADLTAALNAGSALVTDVEQPVSGSLGLLTKARGDRKQLVAILFEQARYDGVVTIRIAGQSIDNLPPDTEFGDGPVPVSITIDPGERYVLGQVSLHGDAADLSPGDFGLVPGGDAGSLRILRAERDVIRRLKDEGRPLARLGKREVVADHPSRTLEVTLSVEAGPIANYGPTTVEGTNTMDPEFTAYMAGLPEGQRYSPQEIDDARERLLALGVFNSVAVREADALNAEGEIPIDVAVTERKMRYFGFGATYSNTDGAGLEGYWGHRNLFGRAETLRFEGAISGIGRNSNVTAVDELDYNAAIMFEKPGVVGPPSKFTARLSTVFEHPDAYDRFAAGGAVGLIYDIGKVHSVSAALSVEFSRITDVFVTDKDYLLVSLPLQYVFDNRDNRLNPTTGFRALGFVEPTYDTLDGTAFVKMRGEGSTYVGLDSADRMILAARLAGGSIMGAALEEVPADRRFYAGGGGSVRGYAYQGVGPKKDGKPIGGLSYAEGSLEARFAVTETIGVVPFVDAGTVSLDEVPDFSDVKVGAGVGLRYLTPFGPLRIDAAIPLNKGEGDPSFGIYAGIGQAF